MYFSINDLNSVCQHAYSKEHSTTTALAQITEDWIKDIENKKIVGTVLLDLSAAFDVLDHEILLEKLICYGFEKSAIEWIKSYLANREFTVTFNGSNSDILTLDCGVPQGSCLGPLLFSIFTSQVKSSLFI